MLGEAEQRRRFAYALSQAMDARGISGRELARRLGLPDSRRVERWRSGRDLPNLYEAPAVAAALGVDEELFRNPPPVPEPPIYPIDRYLLGPADERPEKKP